MKYLTLKIQWNENEKDFMVYYPRKTDGLYVIDHVVGRRAQSKMKQIDMNLWPSEKFLYQYEGYNFYEHDFIQEMKNRGYDTKTLKFSIKIDPNQLKEKFPHIYEDLTKDEKKKLKIK